MPNASAIERLEHRLLELGCPASRIRSQVQEIADHHEDLKQQGLETGLSEEAAEQRANLLLGEPVTLADSVAGVLRLSSWWGRHRIIGFCLLPSVGVFAASLVGLLGVLGLLRLCFSASEWAVLADEGPEFQLIRNGVQGACYAGTGAVAALFCWLARRSIAGPGWALAACGVCSLQSYFGYCSIAPHAIQMGYAVSPDWRAAVIPLVIAFIAFAYHCRIMRPPCFGVRPASERKQHRYSNSFSTYCSTIFGGWQNALSCPTYWIAALVTVAMIILGTYQYRNIAEATARNVDLLTRTWPAERTAVQRAIQIQKPAPSLFLGKTIDLGAFTNTTLFDEIGSSDPVNALRGQSGNNLAELPAGTHLFGGVPFDVRGKVQLMGRGFLQSGRAFPSRAQGIRIGHSCSRFLILHGAAFIPSDEEGSPVKIAALILHYSNGTSKEIEIFSGKHVLDWWGPIMKTEVPATLRETTAPGTELAWVGGNPFIRLSHPEWSLRLYKSSFDNPQPELEVVSIDYVSMLTQAAPFLLGLSVE
jgi:hypothetical protein